MALPTQNMIKYATVLNGGVAKLGTGASTVAATALGTDGGADDAKACYTAGANGGMVESVMLTTDDTAAVNVRLYILDGATVKPVGIVNVPLSSGNAASVKNVDALASIEGLPVNANFKKYIPLKASEQLKVSVLANMTANKILYATSTGVDYAA